MNASAPRSNWQSASINRRQLMTKLAALGLSVPAIGALNPMLRQSIVSAAAQTNEGGTLTYAFWQPIENLDPHVGRLQVEAMINQNTMDPLIWRQPGDPNYYPGLATSWEASEDSMTYTFTLRDDVKFHDGTPFNAEAVKFMFDRIAAPDAPPGLAQVSLGPYDSSEILDEFTIKVNYSAPYGVLLNHLTTVWLAPQSPDMVKKYGPDYQDHLTGTGPYMLKEYAHNDHVTLVRNPDYNWSPSFFDHTGPGLLDAIVFRFIPEDAARVATLKSGDADIIDRVAPRDLADFESSDKFKTFSGPTGGIPWILLLNTAKPPTDDPAVRQAIMRGSDQSAIVDLLFKGTLEPAYSLVEPNMVGFHEEITRPLCDYDLDAAKQLLDDAEWLPGSDGIREKDGQPCSINLMIAKDFGMDEMSVILQSQLREIGIDVQINVVESAALRAALLAGEQNASWGFFFGVDPSFGFNALFSSTGASNYPHYSNPELDQLLIDGMSTSDFDTRDEFYNQATIHLIENAVALPFFHKKQVLASRQSVDLDSVKLNVEGYPNLYNVGFLS